MVPPPGCRAARVLSVCLKASHRMHATSTTVDLASDDVRSPQGYTLLRFRLRGTCPALHPFGYRGVSFRLEKAQRRCARRSAARTPLPYGRDTGVSPQRGSTAWSPERRPFART